MTITKAQTWTIIFLVFILILGIILSVSITEFKNLVNSPAASGNIQIEGDFYIEQTQDDDYKIKYIRINKITGEFSSKIIDIISAYSEIKW